MIYIGESVIYLEQILQSTLLVCLSLFHLIVNYGNMSHGEDIRKYKLVLRFARFCFKFNDALLRGVIKSSKQIYHLGYNVLIDVGVTVCAHMQSPHSYFVYFFRMILKYSISFDYRQ